MKIVFILGAHRTGTKSLAQFFKTHYSNKVNAFHQYASLRIVNVASNLFLAKIISENTFEWIVRTTVIKHIRENSDKPIYLVSNGFNFIAAKYVAKIYPDTLIIHAVRDPRTYVISYLNFIEGRWKSKIANELIPYWHPKINNISNHEMNKLSRMERYIFYWKFKNRYIRENYNSQQFDYLILRIEDIWKIETRKNTLEQLVSVMRLPFLTQTTSFFNSKLNQSQGRKYLKWEKFNITLRKKASVICREEAKYYNYYLDA